MNVNVNAHVFDTIGMQRSDQTHCGAKAVVTKPIAAVLVVFGVDIGGQLVAIKRGPFHSEGGNRAIDEGHAHVIRHAPPPPPHDMSWFPELSKMFQDGPR